MIWFILISVLLVTLLWVLLGPVIIFLNTESNRYTLSLPGIFKAAVVPAEDLFQIRGWIFFIPYRFNPFRRKKKKRKKETQKPRSKKRSMMLSDGMKMGKGIMRSFQIRNLHLNIDTDDFMLNAWLIPIFSTMNHGNIQMNVNFEGTASLLLHIRTRLGALIWALIKTKYSTMFNH